MRRGAGGGIVRSVGVIVAARPVFKGLVTLHSFFLLRKIHSKSKKLTSTLERSVCLPAAFRDLPLLSRSFASSEIPICWICGSRLFVCCFLCLLAYSLIPVHRSFITPIDISFPRYSGLCLGQTLHFHEKRE